jgi:hydroxymethylbilane synthase
MAARITSAMAPELMLPAIAQGVIGIECRCDDEWGKALIAPLNHEETLQRTTAERAMNATLAGGCQAPVAGYSVINANAIELRGLVGRADGSEIIHGDISGPVQQAAALGKQLADDLLSRGARPILDELLHDT